MRNLRNLQFGRWRHPDITSACWDPEKDELLCTVGPTEHSSTIELLRVSDKQDVYEKSASHQTVASWEAPSPNPDLLVDRVISLQYLSGTATTCLVLEGGDIITVQEDQFSSNGPHIEIVGSIDAGIAAAKWSPDEELLAIVTKANALLFMGSTFDPVAEVAMTVEDLKASRHVSVGWGKKETQFQGRGAKAMRDPTIPEKVDSGVLSPNDDGAINISWRGDGAFVAINAIQESEDSKRRVIRVYSREGELDSASEPVDGLESTLSWRPSGNLIAGIQRFDDHIDVVFFERNGLRHGQFRLRSPEKPVVSSSAIRLEWNSDSTALAAMLDGLVQLWTTGNYHWYLKQEIPTEPSTASVVWHSEKALRFAIVTTENLSIVEKIFYTARGSSCPPFDNGAVAVIDGETIKLTPLRGANVPPPMALYELKVESAAVDVAFGRRNQSFAILHRKGVDVYDWPESDGRWIKPQLKVKVPFGPANIPEDNVGLRICCSSEGRFKLMSYQDDLGNLQLSVKADAEDAHLDFLNEDQLFVSTTTYEDDSSIEGYGQDRTGKIHRLLSTGSELLPVQFQTQLPWFEVAKVSDSIIAFGLSRGGHLYANSRLLAKNCTSFVVTPDHLIFTTNNHLVKFVHLAEDVEELEVCGDDPEKDERCRNVERGSRLVTAIPTTMSIVLQMPRGNLETIYPRAMVVAGIRNLIDQLKYAEAFTYCRTQRVDMNILYDHKPEQFLANVGVFLDQLREASYIDLFLSSLRQEDVTETMYPDTKRGKIQERTFLNPEPQPSSELAPTTSKVNTVCDAILKGLQTQTPTSIQNTITAHVCKDPPALEDALRLVAGLMEEGEKPAERAVEHVCFIVDVNRVYDNALGLYNLELALLVAQQSQRDPREYLPFIQDLHKQSDLRRKFIIDDHLSRRTKALSHLHALDVFEELSNYTVKHILYQDALKLYRYDQDRLNQITTLCAAHLESTSAFREAGLAYESLQNYAKATSCYRAAGATCWQECLVSAQLQTPPMSEDALAETATALADALWEDKNYAAAASIHLDYLSSLEQAIRCLCKGYHFAEAIRLVLQKSRPELLTTAVDTGIAEALGSTTEFLADCKAQLNAQVPRIAELRRKAAEDPLAFYEGERAGGADIPDDVSIAASSRVSTSASLFTRYTGKAGSVGTAGTGVSRATSKNRRREEKKRARGRKGTVYEEEYLVNSVRRLVERVMAAKPEVERLVFALVRRGMAERARAAEALLSDVIAACERSVDEVFPKPPLGSGEQQETPDQQGEGSGFPGADWKATGGAAVLQEFVQSQAKLQQPPLVTAMKKLSLLGS